MTLAAKIESARRVLAKDGWRGAVRSASEHVCERVEFVAARRDLGVPVKRTPCSVEFELRRLDDATLTRFKDLTAPLSRHYEYRFQYGMRNCYGAMVGGEVGALMWPFFEADNSLMVTRWRYLLADEARISNVWASREFRGTGLIDACFERFIDCLGQAGFRYLYGYTWIGNEASRRMQARLGFVELGKVVRYSLVCQREGRGLYLRDPIPREPVSTDNPGGDCDLPEVIG